MPTVLTLFPHSRHHRYPYANSCLPDSVKKLFVWVEGSAFEIVTGSIESSFRVFFRRSEEEVVPLGRHSLGVKKSCYFKQGIASVLRVRLVSPNTFSRFSFGEVFFFFFIPQAAIGPLFYVDRKTYGEPLPVFRPPSPSAVITSILQKSYEHFSPTSSCPFPIFGLLPYDPPSPENRQVRRPQDHAHARPADPESYYS